MREKELLSFFKKAFESALSQNQLVSMNNKQSMLNIKLPPQFTEDDKRDSEYLITSIKRKIAEESGEGKELSSSLLEKIVIDFLDENED